MTETIRKVYTSVQQPGYQFILRQVFPVIPEKKQPDLEKSHQIRGRRHYLATYSYIYDRFKDVDHDGYTITDVYFEKGQERHRRVGFISVDEVPQRPLLTNVPTDFYSQFIARIVRLEKKNEWDQQQKAAEEKRTLPNSRRYSQHIAETLIFSS